MSHPSEPIYKSIMGGEILALQYTIVAIAKALEGCRDGIMDGADLDEAIYAAVAILPADMQSEAFRDGLGEEKRSLADCKAKFNNSATFKGFPKKSSDLEDLF